MQIRIPSSSGTLLSHNGDDLNLFLDRQCIEGCVGGTERDKGDATRKAPSFISTQRTTNDVT